MLICAADDKDVSPFWCEIHGSIPNTEAAVNELKEAIETVVAYHREDPSSRFRIYTGKVRPHVAIAVRKG